MALKLKPLGDRLVVEPIEQEETTAGGILLPETAKEKPQEGKVIAAGPGRLDDNGKRVESMVTGLVLSHRNVKTCAHRAVKRSGRRDHTPGDLHLDAFFKRNIPA